jgi:hypothetical protein
MKRFAITSLFLLLSFETSCSSGHQAAAVPCHNDTVRTSPGVFLFLNTGQTYKVFPTDNRVAMVWLPRDKLTVCHIGGAAVEITNISKKSETVRAVRVFDQSSM